MPKYCAEYNVNKEGFQGFLYESRTEKDKAVIVLSGSEGGIFLAKSLAKLFAENGYTTLALAHHKTSQTSKELSDIPIDYIEKAIVQLKKQGYKKIAVYGLSKGAELALLAASILPDITCVIAISPSYCVFEGLSADKKSSSGKSSWTYKGKEIAYQPFSPTGKTVFSRSADKPFPYTLYERAIKRGVPQNAVIKAENIKGSILLLTAKTDMIWPSKAAGDKICERLCEKRFQYDYHHENYEYASHLLIPVDIMKPFILRLGGYLFKADRKYHRQSKISRLDAFKKSLNWLEKW